MSEGVEFGQSVRSTILDEKVMKIPVKTINPV